MAQSGRLRTRDPDQEAARQYVGGALPRVLKAKLQLAAACNGRSLSAEWQSRLERSFESEGVEGCPIELGSFFELLARTMIEVGETIPKTNATAGYEAPRNWVADAYAWDQAARAAMHVLDLSRPDSAEPHGLFASPGYPQEAARELGRRMANGILEVMRERHETEPGTTLPWSGWTSRVRQTLGSIGERLDRHPPPDDYVVASRRRATPQEASGMIEVVKVIDGKAEPDGGA